MGKRSNFERIPRDFYPTPRPAVLPLIPHLRGVSTFAEPCCGDGALVRHLESFKLRCVYAGDIATGQDALARDNYGDADAVITNTPYKRRPMCSLMEHFLRTAPMTWLLLPADWKHNQYAGRFLPYCTDVVSVGRVRWIAGTEMSGMENFAWYRFNPRHSAGPIFHGYNSAPVSSRASLCVECARPYRPQRSDSRFCSDTCRQRAHRSRLAVTSRDNA